MCHVVQLQVAYTTEVPAAVTQAASVRSARAATAPTFAGTFVDTKGHPGCKRQIVRSGGGWNAGQIGR